MGDADFIGKIVYSRGDIDDIHWPDKASIPVEDPRREKIYLGRLIVSDKKLHRFMECGRIFSGIVQNDFDQTGNHVIPLSLNLVGVPGLENARVYKRMAELSEARAEEIIGCADNLPKESTPVLMGCQNFYGYSFYHVAGLLQKNSFIASTTFIASACASSGYIGKERTSRAAFSVSSNVDPLIDLSLYAG